MENIIKVGLMPGRMQEVVVEEGTTVAKVLELAELNADGYQIKINGAVGSLSDVVSSSTKNIILAKMVKGNIADETELFIKVGVMPGKMQEVVCQPGDTVADVLEYADLDSNGYQIKVNGSVGTLDTKITSSTKNIILAKMVKGN